MAHRRPPRTSTTAVAIDRYISQSELINITGLGETTIWRLRRRGDLPEPTRLSPGRVGWRESVIRTWLARRGRS